jgi:hypothetical protein
MYHPPQGNNQPYDRFDDIWMGLFAQRVLVAHGYAFLNGGAVVYHERASDAEVNKKKEAPGIKTNERLWRWVWDFVPEGDDLVADYGRLAEHLTDFEGADGYFKALCEKMHRWLTLVEDAQLS